MNYTRLDQFSNIPFFLAVNASRSLIGVDIFFGIDNASIEWRLRLLWTAYISSETRQAEYQ